MLNIELRKFINPNEDQIPDIFYVVVNGIEDLDSFYNESEQFGRSIHLYNDEAIEAVLSHTYQDTFAEFDSITYNAEIENWDFWIDIGMNAPLTEKGLARFKIQLNLENEHWNKPYTIKEFGSALKGVIEGDEFKDCTYFQEDDDFVSNGFGIEFTIKNPEKNLKEYETKVLEVLEEILATTKVSLLNKIDNDSLTTIFNFPNDIKTACKQYLLYFVQFLLDIGIKVDTELKEEAHKTLFTIIPENPEEGLEKIREALEVYLNSPGFPDIETELSKNNDIAVMQWQANVLHLKSQLTLSASILQAKDATIESLKLTNYQYQQYFLLNTSDPKKDKDEEQIIKDIVAVKNYDGKGFSINFAEIVRRLKRLFK